MALENVFTIEEAAERLKVSTKTIRRLLDSGALKGFRIGSAWRITETALGAFMAEGGTGEEAAGDQEG